MGFPRNTQREAEASFFLGREFNPMPYIACSQQERAG